MVIFSFGQILILMHGHSALSETENSCTSRFCLFMARTNCTGEIWKDTLIDEGSEGGRDNDDGDDDSKS